MLVDEAIVFLTLTFCRLKRKRRKMRARSK